MEKSIEQEVEIALTAAELENKLKSKKSYFIIKRCIDFSAALVLLILLSPLWLLISIIIKLESNGPALFKQTRSGKGGKEFTIYKFRTMSVGSPVRTSSDFEDCRPHITTVGNILRKTSLDEIPQLLNVIKGDMSLIGPRPLLPEYLPLYNAEQIKRHNVLPGLTGWAQINGRNSISWAEKFKLDVWYVENWNLILDLKIFFLTIYSIFKRDGINQSNEETCEYFNGMN